MTDSEKEALQEILDSIKTELSQFKKQRSELIPILQMIQEKFHYLPPEALALVASHAGIAPAEVYGVATFYNQFRFHPPGKHPVKVCLGTACHVKGGDIILENFERKLKIAEGETTEDKEFSIERVACVGCCALAPVALMGETVHGNMAPSKVEGLILRIEVEKEKARREREKQDQNA
jgi:NADH-quinone oxidoreductase subunit E